MKRQTQVLKQIAAGKVSMFCDKCVWHYRDENGDAINRGVMRRLEAEGLIHFSYPTNGGYVNLTEWGRQYVAHALPKSLT